MDLGSCSRFALDSSTDFEKEEQQQQEMESSSLFVEKEHMFDKVVTPSDVGKLNRLVIPKQHAEKYFPLDSSSNDKGLLLNFEDRCGKSWRFRYSYWTSSQSYVMTKGWSRFVKEKRLDAGDIVSFQRGLGHLGKDRFFIDWRRRPPHAPLDTPITFHHNHHLHGGGAAGVAQIPHHFHLHQWTPVATPLSLPRDHLLHLPQNNSNHNNLTLFHNHNFNLYNHHYHHHHYLNPPPIRDGGDLPSVLYHLRSAPPPPPVAVGGGGGGIGKGAASSKTLRLFGVNMECAVSEDQSDDECDITTSTTTMSPQFRVYDGMPMSIPIPMPNSNNKLTTDFFNKGKSSN